MVSCCLEGSFEKDIPRGGRSGEEVPASAVEESGIDCAPSAIAHSAESKPVKRGRRISRFLWRKIGILD